MARRRRKLTDAEMEVPHAIEEEIVDDFDIALHLFLRHCKAKKSQRTHDNVLPERTDEFPKAARRTGRHNESESHNRKDRQRKRHYAHDGRRTEGKRH